VNRDFGGNSLREEVFGLGYKGLECRVNGLGFKI